ncbi:hypothetical protein V6N13_060119 [Hibiscus sabdariffa]
MSSPLSQDVVLARSTHLTREELLKRRLQHLSPFKQNSIQELADDAPVIETSPADDNVHVNNTTDTNICLNFKNNQHCSFVGCKFKAMALTRFCHLHILSDSNQKLYKACTYVIKSAHAGPITCGKPILRSAIPSLCTWRNMYSKYKPKEELLPRGESQIKLPSRKNVLAELFSTAAHVTNAKETKGILT